MKTIVDKATKDRNKEKYFTSFYTKNHPKTGKTRSEPVREPDNPELHFISTDLEWHKNLKGWIFNSYPKLELYNSAMQLKHEFICSLENQPLNRYIGLK